MLFNSYIFVLLFLPICLIGYYMINHFGRYRLSLAFLLGMSLWFYGYFNPIYLLLIGISIIVNYLFYRLILQPPFCYKGRKAVLLAGVLWNLGILGYFKYTDFFIKNINILFQTDFALRNIILPLGISFFTFQQLSLIIDAYRGDIPESAYSLLEYATYIAFFPQLVAGPIVTHDVLIPQLQNISRKSVNWARMKQGAALFTFGLAKKVLLADVFGNAVSYAYQNIDDLNSITAFIAMLAYTIQIYFDFSGYSDMAIGLGWMLNIDLPVNFDSPYQAVSITEFWKRWHITLTAFFRKYVYIPLGGSRKGHIRTYLNILLVFLLSGFWHGAGWTFILWGLIHGLAQILERACGGFWKRMPRILGWVLSFTFVNLTWILFRAESLGDALRFFQKLFCFQIGNIPDAMMIGAMQPEWKALSYLPIPVNASHILLMLFYFAAALFLILAMKNAKYVAENRLNKKGSPFLLAVLLGWCVFSFTGKSVFLYFNF